MLNQKAKPTPKKNNEENYGISDFGFRKHVRWKEKRDKLTYAIDASKDEHRITFSPTKGLSIGSNTIWKSVCSKYLRK